MGARVRRTAATVGPRPLAGPGVPPPGIEVQPDSAATTAPLGNGSSRPCIPPPAPPVSGLLVGADVLVMPRDGAIVPFQDPSGRIHPRRCLDQDTVVGVRWSPYYERALSRQLIIVISL